MRALFCSLLLLVSLCTYAQQQGNADDPIKKIQQIKDDKQRMDSLFNYAVARVENEQPKEAERAGQALMEDAENLNSRPDIGNANRVLGEAYEFMNNYPQALKYDLAALGIYKELNLYRLQIKVMLRIANIYDLTGDLASEKQYVSDAMATCSQHKDLKNVDMALPEILDYLATVYKKENRYDTAIKLYRDAIEMARKYNQLDEATNLLCNLAIALKSNKQYDESLATYNQVIALTDTVNDWYDYSIILDNMSILFYHMGDLKRSEGYGLRAIALLKQNNLDVLRDVYDNLKNVYQQEKRYPEALEYYGKWSTVKDSILNRDKATELTLWQTKYNSEAKDKEIAAQKKQLAYNLRINLALTACVTLLLLLGIIIYRSYNAQKISNTLLSKEKKRSEDLLLNILPGEVAEELKDKGFANAKYFDNVTVVFTDFVNFTKASERMGPQQLIDELHYYFKGFDEIIDKYNIEKIKTIGDSYLAVSGLPVPDNRHAESIVRAAIEINNFVAKRKQEVGDATFEMRIGIHSGSVVASIVGVKKFSYDIWGDTVNTAARMEQNSEPGKINISETTYALVKDIFNCTYRGEIEAKNKGFMKMYFIQA